MPVHRAVPALEHVVGSPWYGARKRFRGVRLVSTDADRTFGEGPAELRGSTADLLLVATGRRDGLRSLAGDGVGPVTERLVTNR
jgi:hypothetical protein